MVAQNKHRTDFLRGLKLHINVHVALSTIFSGKTSSCYIVAFIVCVRETEVPFESKDMDHHTLLSI